MLSVADALRIVLDETPVGATELAPLTFDMVGRILAEDQIADRDSPAFDKSMMDGIAVRSADVETEFELTDTLIAGDVTKTVVRPGQAMRIMTGAPIPPGADAVVPVEQTQTLSDIRVRVVGTTPQTGRHILRRASEYRQGDPILTKGVALSPAVFGLLSGLGKTEAHCFSVPRVSVLSTGNEIVEAYEAPQGSQIRNTNGPMLMALVNKAGGNPRYLGLARDDEQSLRTHIETGLANSDILVISGGVSMGTHDLIPQTLAACGVEIRFHKIAIKPGKPLLFGKKGNICVFGLPGNPVSSMVGFEIFVRSAMRKMRGEISPELKPLLLPLTETLITDNDRPTFLPGRIEVVEGRESVKPIPWTGSANLLAYRNADALIAVEAGKIELGKEILVPVHRFI